MTSFSAEALLLDFGSVITYSAFEIVDRAERRLSLAPGTLTWRGPLDPATDALWVAMQADEISERNYWERRADEVGRLLGQNWTPLDFFRAIRGNDLNEDVRPEIVDLVAEARAAGLKAGILTNELELFGGVESSRSLKIVQSMDIVVDATHTQILKPDPRAYALAVERLGVAPDTVVFVDDQKRNIEGALRAGLQGIYFDVCNVSRSLGAVRAALGLRG
ncbi:MAG: HAD-IA family hydrolase [Alphaproteobacteria bacterium]|nr:HAD-IA family hydrolase [Alphaproteobacteria bacterium]MBU6473290.1 HAD-IA family hydrolase [Alphaproteobacteria bacterium]MDE2013208.1 HAD-IA family hydrolase [Alphaproteobacteria bacterium]MDE2073142.1 HAD-IA family hydrolase [Alphaproteobacteria bacterium]MDE2351105.1 HAD-IA family hydrolase [Alphaproteobacteria bacterium]